MNYYTIKDMETISGVKAHTIRIWEKRYGLLQPERTTTNIRYYSDDELKKLLNVAILVKHGYKISKISIYNESDIQKEVIKINSKRGTTSDVIEQLIVYMVNFEGKRFEDLLNQQIEERGIEYAMMHVITPLFDKIGVFWQTGSIFPAQEHFVSNILRQRLIYESNKYDNSNSTKTILFYLKEDELHELGLLFYNLLALQAGYKTIYLGQNVPFEDLIRVAEIKSIDYIFTAFVNAISKEELESYFDKLNKLVNKKRVFVNGFQVQEHQPKLPRNFKVVTDVPTFKKYFGVLQ